MSWGDGEYWGVTTRCVGTCASDAFSFTNTPFAAHAILPWRMVRGARRAELHRTHFCPCSFCNALMCVELRGRSPASLLSFTTVPSAIAVLFFLSSVRGGSARRVFPHHLVLVSVVALLVTTAADGGRNGWDLSLSTNSEHIWPVSGVLIYLNFLKHVSYSQIQLKSNGRLACLDTCGTRMRPGNGKVQTAYSQRPGAGRGDILTGRSRVN